MTLGHFPFAFLIMCAAPKVSGSEAAAAAVAALPPPPSIEPRYPKPQAGSFLQKSGPSGVPKNCQDAASWVAEQLSDKTHVELARTL